MKLKVGLDYTWDHINSLLKEEDEFEFNEFGDETNEVMPTKCKEWENENLRLSDFFN